jgi:hypothetical protein
MPLLIARIYLPKGTACPMTLRAEHRFLVERLCKSVKYKHVELQARLVADLLQVLAQLDNGVERIWRLDGVGVVGDEECLCGLVGDDAFLALCCVSQCCYAYLARWVAHLLRLQRVIGGLDCHVLLAVDLNAVCDDGLGLALVVEGGGNGAHLGCAQLEPVSTWSRCLPLYPVSSRRHGWCMRCDGLEGRTVKSGDEAQVVWPLTSQMRARSMLPVPTRL